MSLPQRSGTKRVVSLRRSGTTKVPDATAKRGKGYDIVEQTIKQLYPPEDDSATKCNVDIVLVPGLGAHPIDSWKSASTDWNWTTSPEGLIRDFPKARILLYMYESVWTGALKITQQFLSNIAMNLMVALRSLREDCKSRPIVFIGHSMGGLVVAKALTYADTRRGQFPVMFEAVAGTVFFGTPFKGAEAAAWAAMYASFAKNAKMANTSKLLDTMKPGDESLRELRHDFTRLVGRLAPNIQVVCFWEQEQTDFLEIAHLPTFFGLAKKLVPKGLADFVTYDSATLDGATSPGLACNHRDLVKFDGPKDGRWSQSVREHLKRVISGAVLIAKSRVASARDVDYSSLKSIADALGNPQADKKRKDIAKAVAISSWITEATEYKDWFELPKPQDLANPTSAPTVDCLWIRGREGRGKTGAAIAAVKNIDKFVKDNEEQNIGQDGTLLACFLCDPATDYCTAEDLLKSLICQIIDQQPAVATHANGFIKKKGRDGTYKAQVQATIENLWQCLQNMISDDFIGGRLFLIVNNLHVLPEDSDSTIKLMTYLASELRDTKPVVKDGPAWRVSTRWLITSRDSHNVSNVLNIPSVRLVDLEDQKYGNKVQLELRKHAKDKVSALEVEKKYNKALAYFASSLIGKRAQNIHWIDITCVQLEELSEGESHLKVRRVLEDTPQDLSDLLNEAWRQIFAAHDDNGENIKEMLRALILTYEDPTEHELGVLAGWSSSEEDKEELHGLIEHCKPLLSAKKVVSFMNPAVKGHLVANAQKLLGLSEDEIKWQHGILALRSLSHIKEEFNFPDTEPPLPVQPEDSGVDNDADQPPEGAVAADGANDQASDDDDSDSDTDSELGGFAYDDEEEDDDMSELSSADGYAGAWDEEEEDKGPEADVLKDKALAYPVKYWLRHGSKASLEFADDLSLEEEFWKSDSLLRRRWVVKYSQLTGDFEYFDRRSLTGLHVAAAVGFKQLVSSLIDNGYANDLHTHDQWGNTPLHFAAAFGRTKIVQELLDRNAIIDDRDENGDDTPLHMAAEAGHVEVMKNLIFRGANPNAYSKDSGFVINAAISSGKLAAVELLVDKNVSLTLDGGDIESPLAQAATLNDISIMEYLMKKYEHQLPAEEYSKALVSAAGAGRVENFNRLLGFEHKLEDFQWALDSAAEEGKWDVVTIILEKRSDLNCDEAFYQAAIGMENKDQVLEALWEYTQGGISSEMVDSSLYDATDREKEHTVKLLLVKFGADPNATGEVYGNALTAAAYDGRLDILRLLLDAGANVNSPDGWAIQTAAAEGHIEIVQELLARNADVNALTTNENFPSGTALQAATEYGRQEIVEILLKHDADPNLGGGEDAPPVLAAALYASEEILCMLVDAKADVNVYSKEDGATPLINAAQMIPGTAALQKLLDAGADINATDEDGMTALIGASMGGDEEVVQFLLDNGADIMHVDHDGTNALKAGLESNGEECMRVLVDHVSTILSALKSAMDSGNAEVTALVRNATASRQGLPYDDEDEQTKAPEPAEDSHDDFGNHVQIISTRSESISIGQQNKQIGSVETSSGGFIQSQAIQDGQQGGWEKRPVYEQVSIQPPTFIPSSYSSEPRPYQGLPASSSPPPTPPKPYNEQGRRSPPTAQSSVDSLRKDTGLVKRKPAPVAAYPPKPSSYPSTPDPGGRPYNIAPPPSLPVTSYQAYNPGSSVIPIHPIGSSGVAAAQAAQIPGSSQPIREPYRQNSAPAPMAPYGVSAPSNQAPATSQNHGSPPSGGKARPESGASAYSQFPAQDISSYDGSQWGNFMDSGTAAYRDEPGPSSSAASSAYANYFPKQSAAPVTSRPQPQQQSYSSPALIQQRQLPPQQQQQQQREWAPPVPPRDTPVQGGGPGQKQQQQQQYYGNPGGPGGNVGWAPGRSEPGPERPVYQMKNIFGGSYR
ncbi:hypothetical protein BX600DRAFT_391706 [Xylariales sp. PMI_506]|nr:hypothetical protein BX600DRAFT_391706 [Xylariales sp. PMI_506]